MLNVLFGKFFFRIWVCKAINLNYGSGLSSYMNIFAAFKLYFLIKVSIFFDLSNFYR